MATLTSTGQTHSVPSGAPVVLKLQQEDHLTRDEFERRYDAMPELKKAELIEGVVYMSSPVAHRDHGKPHFNVIGWLGSYVMLTPEIEGGDNSSLKLDLKNMPQPDAFLYVPAERGGRGRLDAKGYIVGAPEHITEVSASSASYDLHSKLEAYRRNGVKEYVVWRVLERAIDWFVLEGEQFVPLPCADGIYRSRVFPGLWLDVQALLEGQLHKVLETVQKGDATDEHSQFRAALKAASAT